VKLTISCEPLLEACRAAERLLPERPIDVPSGHLLLRACDGGCSLLATDHDAALCQELPATVEATGEALVPARTLLAVLREVRTGEVTLEAVGDALNVRRPGTRFKLEARPTALFPPHEPFPGGPCHLVEAPLLRRAVLSTLFAAGTGSHRYFLEALLWEVEADRLRLIATDNRRLAVAEVPVLARCEHLTPARRLLPARAVAQLARLPGGEDGPVEALFGAARAFFRCGAATLSCRYAEGHYPRWRAAVPQSSKHRLALPVRPLLSAVRQAAVLREREGARLLIRFEPGRLVLESQQAGAGRSRVGRVVPFEGEPVQVALDPRYLLQMLQSLEGEETVQVGLTDADTPALFRAGGFYTHVMMPMKSG
jgi:DNA polymerase III subunit beta